jgi:hypothetical protein
MGSVGKSKGDFRMIVFIATGSSVNRLLFIIWIFQGLSDEEKKELNEYFYFFGFWLFVKKKKICPLCIHRNY